MSQSQNNLDLTKIASEDVEQLASRINNFYKSDSALKNQLSWHWERNHLMLDGKQWLQYDGGNAAGGLWQKVRVSKQNEYIPRPVTNYIYDIYQTLKSYLIKNKPRCKVFPEDPNNYRDKLSAKIATLVCEANWERLKESFNYETAACNLVTYGTVFKKSYWDTSSLNRVKVPRMRVDMQHDPQTGAPIPGSETEIQELDPMTGDPMFDELPLGELNTTVVEPQRMCLDPLAMHLHEARWVMEYTIQPLDWIKETYSKEAEGFTGLAEQVEEDKDLNGSLRRWFQLRTTSGVKSNNLLSSGGASSSDTMVENCSVVKDYYEAPSARHPKGRLIVVAGKHVVYSGESPYEGPEQGDWHPYSECRWELVPGRFWGKSPIDDCAEIQKQINSIDSAIILTRKTMAVPQKLIPQGTGVTPGSWTGRPGHETYYRADGTGAKPETVPAQGVDPTVFQERAQRVDDMKTVSGAIDILKGDRPAGVNAASALSLLYEVGTGKLYPILERWKMFVESDQKKQLRIIQKFYKEPRDKFIQALKAKNEDLPQEDINHFIGSDLNDNCNVIVEAGSNIPKLQAAHQSLLLQLAQMGMLNLANPSNRVQFQQDLGIAGYDSDIEPDRKRAMWENDLLDNIEHSPDNKPIVLAADNHDLHIADHENRMKNPNFMSQPQVVQQAYLAHVEEHKKFKNMQMQEMMLQQLAMGMPPGQETPGFNPPSGAGDSQGKGVPSSIAKATLGADLINPATIGTQR